MRGGVLVHMGRDVLANAIFLHVSANISFAEYGVLNGNSLSY